MIIKLKSSIVYQQPFHNKIMASKDKIEKDGLKVREFQWYEIETKVREVMGELLQPFNKKQTEDTIKINQIKRTQANILKKLEEHDFLFSRESRQKPTYIQLQDDKISQLEEALLQNHIESEGRLKRMETIISVYEQKIAQLNSFQRRLDKELLERVEQFKKYKETLDKEAELMLKRQDTHFEEMTQFKNTTKSAVSKAETRMIGFDNRLKDLQDEQKHRFTDIKKLLQDVANAHQKLFKLEAKAVELQIRVEDRERDTKLSQKFMSKVKQIEGEFNFLSNFLQQYQPLYFQMQLSQTLNSFVQGKQRRKLCIYEEQTFAKLHHHILLNQKITLEDMMNTYSVSIKKITNRNKKYVVNLAVAQTLRCGGNLYEFRVQNLADIDEDEDSAEKIVAAIDPQQIICVVNSQLEGVRKQLKELVAMKLVPTRTWMEQLQEQLMLRSMDYDSKHDMLQKQIKDIITQMKLQQNHVSKELGQLNVKQEQLSSLIGNFKDNVRDIFNFNSVINHIVIQDQIDRQGTALYALRAEKGENVTPPTIQLDPNCLNCESKTSGVIQKAYKMACLTYNPSQIKIDDQMFSREQILEISTGILEKLKKWLYSPEVRKVSPQLVNKRRSNSKNSNELMANKKRSESSIKHAYLGNQTARGKELQTLLPTLGATKQRHRQSQVSVFY